MKTKYLAVGIGAVVAAAAIWVARAAWRAHYDLVTLHVRNAPLADVVRKIERQTWEKVFADKKLNARVTLDVKNMPLPNVLNLLAAQTSARWGKTYAVYEAKNALRRLESVLHGDSKLDAAGWTNVAPQFSKSEAPESDPLQAGDATPTNGTVDDTTALPDGTSSSATAEKALQNMMDKTRQEAAAGRATNGTITIVRRQVGDATEVRRTETTKTGKRMNMMVTRGTANPGDQPVTGFGGGTKRIMPDGRLVETHFDGPNGAATTTTGGRGGGGGGGTFGRGPGTRTILRNGGKPGGNAGMGSGPGSGPGIVQGAIRIAPDGTAITNITRSQGTMRAVMRSGPGGSTMTTMDGDGRMKTVRTSPDGTTVVEDEWSSERLVMETRLNTRLGSAIPEKATPETAARTARQVRGQFATYYALEKAPFGTARLMPSALQWTFSNGDTNNPTDGR